MTEEINHSYDGGLYAELIQNRAFLDDATTRRPLVGRERQRIPPRPSRLTRPIPSTANSRPACG